MIEAKTRESLKLREASGANLPKPTILSLCPTWRDRHYLSRESVLKHYNIIFLGDEVRPERFNASRFIKQTIQKIKREKLRCHGVIGTDDYPACLIAAVVAKRLKFVFPSLESIYLCQHKFLSRLAQKQSVPEATPKFSLITLNHKDPQDEIPLKFPYFVKPVKSYLSIFAQKVHHKRELAKLKHEASRGLKKFVKPFNALLEKTDLPAQLIKIDGHHLVAEELLKGHQATLEGYVFDGKVTIIGTTDSIFYPNQISFKHFQYPSRLPSKIQTKMAEIARKFIRHIGFDNSLFNIEFFYDSFKKSIKIIEVNPRMASQFASLVEGVDGTNTYDILLSLSLAQKSQFKKNQGLFKVAASFVMRTFKDRKVTELPPPDALYKIKTLFPESVVQILVRKGKRLSDFEQDGRSFRYAIVNLAAQNEKELFHKFEICKKILKFKFVRI